LLAVVEEAWENSWNSLPNLYAHLETLGFSG
jgi:hypothetical protein